MIKELKTLTINQLNNLVLNLDIRELWLDAKCERLVYDENTLNVINKYCTKKNLFNIIKKCI